MRATASATSVWARPVRSPRVPRVAEWTATRTTARCARREPIVRTGAAGFTTAVASVNAVAGVAVPDVTDSSAGGVATRVPGSAEVDGSLASGGRFTGVEDWSAGTGAGSTGGGVTVPGSGVGAGGSGVTVGVDADGSVVAPGSAGVASGGVGAGTSATVSVGADEASVDVTSAVRVRRCRASDEQQQREEDQGRAREKQQPQSTRGLRLRCDD